MSVDEIKGSSRQLLNCLHSSMLRLAQECGSRFTDLREVDHVGQCEIKCESYFARLTFSRRCRVR